MGGGVVEEVVDCGLVRGVMAALVVMEGGLVMEGVQAGVLRREVGGEVTGMRVGGAGEGRQGKRGKGGRGEPR